MFALIAKFYAEKSFLALKKRMLQLCYTWQGFVSDWFDRHAIAYRILLSDFSLIKRLQSTRELSKDVQTWLCSETDIKVGTFYPEPSRTLFCNRKRALSAIRVTKNSRIGTTLKQSISTPEALMWSGYSYLSPWSILVLHFLYSPYCHILYANRAQCYLETHKFTKAYFDGWYATLCNLEYAKVYYSSLIMLYHILVMVSRVFTEWLRQRVSSTMQRQLTFGFSWDWREILTVQNCGCSGRKS